jgi:hypothetical protein
MLLMLLLLLLPMLVLVLVLLVLVLVLLVLLLVLFLLVLFLRQHCPVNRHFLPPTIAARGLLYVQAQELPTIAVAQNLVEGRARQVSRGEIEVAEEDPRWRWWWYHWCN